jgi:hypothetical protein
VPDAEWRISATIDGARTTVTHERGEVEMAGSAFRVAWRLVLTMQPLGHALSIASVEPKKPGVNVEALRRVLDATVARAMSSTTGVVLPDVREYMSAGYFNWK